MSNVNAFVNYSETPGLIEVRYTSNFRADGPSAITKVTNFLANDLRKHNVPTIVLADRILVTNALVAHVLAFRLNTIAVQ